MTTIKISHADSPNLAERFGLLSSMISENFSAPWSVEPVGPVHSPAHLSWACADGVSISRAEMPAIRLFNPGTKRQSAGKFYAATTNQRSILKIEGREPIHLEPDEVVIVSSFASSEWVITRPYTTSSLIIDSDLFCECVPNHASIVGRKLALPFNLNDVLFSTMESAWAITCGGMLELAGPRLVRSFLEMLSLVPSVGQQVSCPTKTALDIRKKQVKGFIDKNYMMPTLSVAYVAERLQLSPRYVQMAFADDAQCPSEYLRSVRLSACARMLRDPASARRSITQISFDCGFNSSAHFSTEFRRVFGMTPREYRRCPVDA